MSAITVEKLIESKPYLFGSQPVISGSQGLGRLVTNINVMEVPDVYPWVREGDFLLTTAYSIKDNEAAQNELIPKLDLIGIAALGIKRKRYMTQVPPLMVEMSEKYRFPILDLNYNIGYSQTISEVLEEILNRKAKWLTELHEKIQLLTQTMLMGENLKTIVYTIARCIETDAGIVLPSGPGFATHSDLQFSWPSYEEDGNGEYRVDDFAFFPIRKNKEAIAYLVCRSSPSHGADYRLFLQHASALLSLYFAKQHALNEIEDSQRDKFLKMWVLGETSGGQNIMLHAAMVGIQLKDKYYVCVTSKAGSSAPKNLFRIRSVLSAKGIHLLSLDNEWILLVPDDGKYGDDQSFLHILTEIKTAFRLPFLRIGVSDPAAFQNVSQGYKEASHLLDIGTVMLPEAPIYRYGNLGMLPVIHRLGTEDGIRNQLLQRIEPLYDYDTKNQSKLVETLEAYLLKDGNIKETAGKLFCHYNSVLYRLEKIQTLLQTDLKDAETKFQLLLALRVFDYIQKKREL